MQQKSHRELVKTFAMATIVAQLTAQMGGLREINPDSLNDVVNHCHDLINDSKNCEAWNGVHLVLVSTGDILTATDDDLEGYVGKMDMVTAILRVTNDETELAWFSPTAELLLNQIESSKISFPYFIFRAQQKLAKQGA